jgi:ketosteroid isomerase-like protein
MSIETAPADADDVAAVTKLVKALNLAWRSGGPDVAARVAPFFTQDAVIAGPDLRRAARGRDAVAASYAEFLASATVLEYEQDAPEVDLSGDVAVATLGWTMTYENQGGRSTERGHDVYVLARRPEWQIVWRYVAASAVTA